MESGRYHRSAGLSALTLLCGLLAGCGLGRSHLDEKLLARQPMQGAPERLASDYLVRFPDVLEVQVQGRPQACGVRPLRVDGRIELAPQDLLRVEGKATPAIAQLIADHLQLERDRVNVRVHEYNSQRIFLQGEVAGETRAVPYVGPEPVLDMLQRVGGITSGAAPGDIQVVRAQIAEGKQPEVFEVNLEAILTKNENETNVKLRPFDHVHVGQRRSCSIRKCLPPWLRPLFARLSGLTRPGSAPPPALAERSAPRYRASRLE